MKIVERTQCEMAKARECELEWEAWAHETYTHTHTHARIHVPFGQQNNDDSAQ